MDINEKSANNTSTIGTSGDGIAAGTGMWSFKGGVPACFDNHVRRSVPLYDEGHELVLRLSEYFIAADSICYEIGCSTGTLTRRLADKHNNKKGATFIGIDIEEEMVCVARNKMDREANIRFACSDARLHEYEKADLIVAYYTVQFIQPKYRQIVVDRLYSALNWSGALILFEKVRAPDARFQDIAMQTYTDFKMDAGYSAEEIVNKSRSLKRVLDPFSSKANIEMLQRSGFVDIMSVMKYLSFEGFLAIK